MSEVATGSKELLPVGSKPAIQWALDEVAGAGLSEVVVVTSSSKPDLVEFVASSCGLTSVSQDIPRGLSHAVTLPHGFRPALVVLPDTIFFPSSPAKRMVAAVNRGFDIAIAVEKVPDELVSRYGIVEFSPETLRITRILEKPPAAATPSRWAIAARFALSSRTMLFLRERVLARLGEAGEIDLPPLLDEAVAAGFTALAVPLEAGEERLDCGSPSGYERACEVVNAGL